MWLFAIFKSNLKEKLLKTKKLLIKQEYYKLVGKYTFNYQKMEEGNYVKGKISMMTALTMLIILLCCAGVMASQSGTASFTDVDSSNSKLVYINYLAEKGVISGFPDGSFKPLEGLTRAEAATVIVKAKNLPLGEEEASLFNDVDDSHWASAYIATAQEAGFLNGFPDNTYRPEQYLTRAEAVSLLLKLSDEVYPEPLILNLNDVEETHWAIDAINNSLVSGMIIIEGSNFFPDDSITREDLAQALAVLMIKAPDLYKTDLTATLKVINGTVKLLSPGESEPLIIEKEISLKVGDKITTTSKGEAEMLFPDGSGFLIKPGTEITLTESQGRAYIKENGQIGNAVDSVAVKLDVGKIFAALATTDDSASMALNYLGGPLFASLDDEFVLMAANANQKALPWYQQSKAKKVKVKVDMPWGVAAVRGTFFSAGVDPSGRSVVSVLSGHVDLTSGGQTTLIQPGNTSSIDDPDAPPVPPTPMPPNEAEEWQQEQDWLLERAQDMSDQQALDPSAPNEIETSASPEDNNPVQEIQNALNQLESKFNQTSTPTSDSGGSSRPSEPSEPTTPTSDPLDPELMGINHLTVYEKPEEIIWAIAVLGLQEGDIVKVYRNQDDTIPLVEPLQVPSSYDRIIFPVIHLDSTEGSLWLTRTSINKEESPKTELPFKILEKLAPIPDLENIMVFNNPGAKDEVRVKGLDLGEMIVVYLGDNIVLISDPAGEDGIATVSGLTLNPNGGYVGIRITRPDYYLNEIIVQKYYEPENIISDVLEGVPDRVFLLLHSSASFYIVGDDIEVDIVNNETGLLIEENIWDNNVIEIKVTHEDGYELGRSFTLRVTKDEQVLEKEIYACVLERMQLEDKSSSSQVLLLEKGYEQLNLKILIYEEPDKIGLVNYDSFKDVSEKITVQNVDNNYVYFTLKPGLETGHYLVMVYYKDTSNEIQPLTGSPFFVIGETAGASITVPENDSGNNLNEIKFTCESLNSNKVKLSFITELLDFGGLGFWRQYEEDYWDFSYDEYWLDLECEESGEEWEILGLPEPVFYNSHEYTILLKVNTKNGPILTSSRFTYDEAPELNYAFWAGSNEIELGFSEQVQAVSDKNIYIIVSLNGEIQETITVGTNELMGDFSNVIIINTSHTLNSNQQYQVVIQDGAFVDRAGNKNKQTEVEIWN